MEEMTLEVERWTDGWMTVLYHLWCWQREGVKEEWDRGKERKGEIEGWERESGREGEKGKEKKERERCRGEKEKIRNVDIMYEWKTDGGVIWWVAGHSVCEVVCVCMCVCEWSPILYVGVSRWLVVLSCVRDYSQEVQWSNSNTECALLLLRLQLHVHTVDTCIHILSYRAIENELVHLIHAFGTNHLCWENK